MTRRQMQTQRRIIEIINRGNPQISYDRLAAELETDRRVVIRHIYSLEKAGRLRITRGRGIIPNTYQVIH